MKKIISHFKIFFVVCAVSMTSIALAQSGGISNVNCLNHFPSQDPIVLKIQNGTSTLTNAISTTQSTSSESDGINTYTVYITNVVIPYYATTLTGEVKISTSSFCTYTYFGTSYTTDAKLVVNGTEQTTNTYSITSGLAIGANNFATKAKINFTNGTSTICTQKYFRINVIKEAAPSINLTLSAYCQKDNHTNLYTGYLGFNVNGTVANLSPRLYFVTTNTAGTCTDATRLTDISATGTFAGQFFSCNSNGTYTVKLSHRFTNIAGSAVIRDFNAGELGWNNYAYTKTFATCMNVMDPKSPILAGKMSNEKDNPKTATLYPNPVQEKMNVSVAEERINSIVIYDNQNHKLFEVQNNENLEGLEINTSSLKPGIYILVTQTKQSNYIQKFVKN